MCAWQALAGCQQKTADTKTPILMQDRRLPAVPPWLMSSWHPLIQSANTLPPCNAGKTSAATRIKYSFTALRGPFVYGCLPRAPTIPDSLGKRFMVCFLSTVPQSYHKITKRSRVKIHSFLPILTTSELLISSQIFLLLLKLTICRLGLILKQSLP